MPTKRNSAGEQQNYIPPGHGDASGEYGDNATGSNIHVQIRLKDDPITSTEPTREPKKDTTEQSTDKGGNKAKTGNSHERISEYLRTHSTFTKSEQEFLSGVMSKGDSDCNSVLANALEKGNYQYSKGKGCFRVAFNELKVDASNLKDDVNSYVPGGVFYHESGHLVDWANSDTAGTTFLYQKRPASATFVSEKYNTTLNDMVKQEGKEMVKAGAVAKLLAEKIPIRNEYLEKAGFTEEKRQQLDEQYKQYNAEMDVVSNADNAEWNKIVNDYVDHKMSYEEYTKLRLERSEQKDKQRSEIYKKYQQMFDDRSKMTGIERTATEAFNRKYGDISDMIDGATKGRQNLGMLHGRSYWNKSDFNQGVEFFAETFEAKAVNPESLSVIKQYFPKSYEIFEEILRRAGK